ncbi:Rpn family recombination-promoting nuclease/putative transposase [Skermanella pratensis]|uniref:Rpn family recombination-promoting nuclease/putative transposase n=1 Tax=Skermanella pratensis TaxID=2233999 RepID=UPI0013018695|nr:Rpn family recombination-promoting nuclease/putative transposase [Skermanella pratensis]
MPASDSLYHRLFSHPSMVEQLIRGFVPEEVAAGLDFTRMERVNAKFHARDGRRREGDLIWRVPTLSGEVVHIYLMLEFQSRTDWWMAIRVMVYVGLLWQQLIQELKLPAGPPLPPVLPVVLYNGEAPWNAPLDTAGLMGLDPDAALWPWQPSIRYHLIDEGRLGADDLARRDGLVALLFRIETCTRPAELPGLVREVIGWFQGHAGHDSLKLAFGEVVAQAVAALVGGDGPVTVPSGLWEVQDMLSERIKIWERELKAEALAEGMTAGRAEMLSRQLRRRFGDLPADADRLIASATIDQLDTYMDRLMEARSVADVFPDLRPG